jgi:hypothetical protein
MGFAPAIPAILGCPIRRKGVGLDPFREGSSMNPLHLWWRGLILATVACLTCRSIFSGAWELADHIRHQAQHRSGGVCLDTFLFGRSLTAPRTECDARCVLPSPILSLRHAPRPTTNILSPYAARRIWRRNPQSPVTDNTSQPWEGSRCPSSWLCRHRCRVLLPHANASLLQHISRRIAWTSLAPGKQLQHMGHSLHSTV